MPEPISKYLSAIDGLDAVAARFRHVMIEHLPALDLFPKYDGPDVLFYCDPPYPGSTRSGGKAATYGVEMDEQDHHKLLTTLRQCRGKVLLSSYDSTLYRTILHDWQCLKKETHVQFSNSGGHRRELLWKNW